MNYLPTPDCTGPTAPTVSISPNGWTNQTSPTVTWSGITDEGDHLSGSLCSIDNGGWWGTGSSYPDSGFLITGVSYQNIVNGGTTPVTISQGISYNNGNLATVTAADGTVTSYNNYNSFNKPGTPLRMICWAIS